MRPPNLLPMVLKHLVAETAPSVMRLFLCLLLGNRYVLDGRGWTNTIPETEIRPVLHKHFEPLAA
ncbi:hypothetical protein SIL73_17510 [Acidithiobacillus thiooxidans]|uniref:hypothetical protein n=1 Tax=Acidithiobacillus thiooxidans TaxID=930 RepID=UPI0029C485D9|nr:hypothetical protein [Acidithiobacillus thiooxidans]MDX5936455.1 hypothetical protein [Acidithiobacillus thiooxidans]